MKITTIILYLLITIATALAGFDNVTLLGLKPGMTVGEALETPVLKGKPVGGSGVTDALKIHFAETAPPADFLAALAKAHAFVEGGELKILKIAYKITVEMTCPLPRLVGVPVTKVTLLGVYSIEADAFIVTEVAVDWKQPETTVDDSQLLADIREIITKQVGYKSNGSKWHRHYHWDITETGYVMNLSYQGMGIYHHRLARKFQDEFNDAARKQIESNPTYKASGTLQ